MSISLDIKVEQEFLATLVQKPEMVDSSLFENITPDLFSVDAYKWFVKQLIERSWEVIPLDFLGQVLLDAFDDQEKIDQYSSQLSLLYSKELTFSKDSIVKIKSIVVYKVLKKSVAQSFNNFERSQRVDYLLKDLKEGVDVSDRIVSEKASLEFVDYANDYANRVEKRRLERDNPNLNPRVLFGIDKLDEVLEIKAPDIINFLAPMKRYKSLFLNTMGYSTLMQGFNSLHAVFENTIDLTMGRYDAMFSGYNYTRMKKLLITQEEKDQFDKTMDWVGSWDSRIKVVKTIPKKTTMKDIEDNLKRFQDESGWSPDVLILDYLNIMAPDGYRGEERIEQERILWNIKEFADKYNTIVFTATQANREGLETGRMSQKAQGKSIGISQGVDVTIAIDQDEEEKEAGLLVLTVQFCRDGSATGMEIPLDTNIPCMHVDKSLHKMWDQAIRNHPYGISS